MTTFTELNHDVIDKSDSFLDISSLSFFASTNSTNKKIYQEQVNQFKHQIVNRHGIEAELLTYPLLHELKRMDKEHQDRLLNFCLCVEVRFDNVCSI